MWHNLIRAVKSFIKKIKKKIRRKLSDWHVLRNMKDEENYLSLILLITKDQQADLENLTETIGAEDIVETFNTSLGLLYWVVEQLQDDCNICSTRTLEGDEHVVIRLEPDFFEHIRTSHVDSMRAQFQKLFEKSSEDEES